MPKQMFPSFPWPGLRSRNHQPFQQLIRKARPHAAEKPKSELDCCACHNSALWGQVTHATGKFSPCHDTSWSLISAPSITSKWAVVTKNILSPAIQPSMLNHMCHGYGSTLVPVLHAANNYHLVGYFAYNMYIYVCVRVCVCKYIYIYMCVCVR